MAATWNEEEIDALVAEFTSVTSEEDPGFDKEEVIRSRVTWKESRKSISSTRSNRHVSSSSSS